jgi:hypothetical protein
MIPETINPIAALILAMLAICALLAICGVIYDITRRPR